jgi:hypothetical protein
VVFAVCSSLAKCLIYIALAVVVCRINIKRTMKWNEISQNNNNNNNNNIRQIVSFYHNFVVQATC